MVDDAQYPDGLFAEPKNVRKRAEVNSHEVQELANTVRLLENTVRELRKDIQTLRGDLIDQD